MPFCCCRLPSSWAWGCCFPWSAFPWSSTTGPAHRGVTKATETSWEHQHSRQLLSQVTNHTSATLITSFASLQKQTEIYRILQMESHFGRKTETCFYTGWCPSKIWDQFKDHGFPPTFKFHRIIFPSNFHRQLFYTLLTQFFVTSWSLRTLKT